MNESLKKILSVTICAVLAILFIITMHFSVPEIAQVKETEGEISYSARVNDGDSSLIETKTAVIGRDVTAVRISDLNDLQTITKVNYVAGEYVKPNSLPENCEIVDLTKSFEFAEKGTLIFIIMNLDPFDENVFDQIARLSEYKTGDYWHFTMNLPKIFSASNVYLKANLVARHGELEDYDFINFNTSYDKRTDKFSPLTSATVLDLKFYTRRETMDHALGSAQIVTVHYQSNGSAYSGIRELPVLGAESAVINTLDLSGNLLLAAGIIACVAFTVLIVLSLLKKTTDFISAGVWILGIIFILISRFILAQITVAPLIWIALAACAPFLCLGGALFAVAENYKKMPAKYVLCAMAFAGALAAFIHPFLPYTAAMATTPVCVVIKAICAVALAALTVLAALRKDGRHGTVKLTCAALISVTSLSAIFLPIMHPVQSNSVFWLCFVTVITTFVGVFIVFKETEKSNAYLTANLHMEVGRQVKEIRAVIEERDNLLQFVSHDMKKPLQASLTIVDTLIDRHSDNEQIKALKIVKNNTERVVNNLSGIGEYARFNYIAEPSQVVDLKETCAAIYDFHLPDCNANGIILKNQIDKSCKVFVKKQGLENAVSNIIMNAVEHADCKTITVSCRKERNKIVLCIADDGKGISSEMDVFRPYVTEKTETGGIGLYICKSIIESMNGTLTYQSVNGATIFYITLLKA